jgi:coenzyme F420-reducing hydrogenase delta subunit
MVHPSLVIEAFNGGADGVLIMGCNPGECHYQNGNDKAEARSAVIEEILSLMGLEPGRFGFVRCFSSDAERFAGIMRQTVDALRAMGPSRPPKEDQMYSKSEPVQCL